MSVRLRPARPVDADPCARILADWIAETPWMPRLHTPTEDINFMLVKIRTHRVTIAESDDVLGFLTLETDYVSALYVSSAARSQGIGKRLLDDAKSRAPRLSLWTFQANMPARRFYLREGFEEARRTEDDNEEKMPDVEYVWSTEIAE
ncbi:GNAT family N-acetyltransferase [Halovulum sp. GXIMD14793]